MYLKTLCYKYGVLVLALTLAHFDIVINKTSCFRSKREIQDIKNSQLIISNRFFCVSDDERFFSLRSITFDNNI